MCGCSTAAARCLRTSAHPSPPRPSCTTQPTGARVRAVCVLCVLCACARAQRWHGGWVVVSRAGLGVGRHGKAAWPLKLSASAAHAWQHAHTRPRLATHPPPHAQQQCTARLSLTAATGACLRTRLTWRTSTTCTTTALATGALLCALLALCCCAAVALWRSAGARLACAHAVQGVCPPCDAHAHGCSSHHAAHNTSHISRTSHP